MLPLKSLYKSVRVKVRGDVRIGVCVCVHEEKKTQENKTFLFNRVKTFVFAFLRGPEAVIDNQAKLVGSLFHFNSGLFN